MPSSLPTFIPSPSLPTFYIFLIFMYLKKKKQDGAWVRDNGMRVLIQSAAAVVDLNPPPSSSQPDQESVLLRSPRRSDTVSRTEFEAMAKRALHAESKIEVLCCCCCCRFVCFLAQNQHICLSLSLSHPPPSICQTLIFERVSH
jgi:hypothetical protein